MYNRNKKQFIIKLSNQETWNFFFDETNGLSYTYLNSKKIWSKATSIHKNIHPSFYVDIDSNDNFHIVFQDLSGNIFYSFMNSKTIKTIQILKSKLPSAYNKYLHLIPLKDTIHFFYILHHKNSIILTHQILKNTTLSNPSIIASSVKSTSPYSIFHDSFGKIYIYYQFFDGQHFQLGYKVYSPFEALWTNFQQITHSNCDIDFSHTIIDPNNITHICYQKKISNSQYQLCYQQTPSSLSTLQNEKLVTPLSNTNFDNSGLIKIYNTLIIFWIKNDIIYCTKSFDNGTSWSSSSEVNFSNEKYCVAYKSNFSKDINNISSNNIPANFINGYTLAFFNNSLDTGNVNSISANDFKTIVLDSLNLLKNNFEKLNISVSQLKNSYENLALKQIELEKELTKEVIKNQFVQQTPTDNSYSNNSSSYNISTSSNTFDNQNALDPEMEYQKFLKELKANYKPSKVSIPDRTITPASLLSTKKTVKKKYLLNKNIKNMHFKKSI